MGDSLEMGRAGPEASQQMTSLFNYVNQNMTDAAGRPLYSFDRTGVFNSQPWLLDDFILPPMFMHDESRSTWGHLTLNIGPTGEGLPFHYHDAALNSVVYGAKRWFICPNYQNLTESQFEQLKVFLGGESTGFGQNIRMADWLRTY